MIVCPDVLVHRIDVASINLGISLWLNATGNMTNQNSMTKSAVLFNCLIGKDDSTSLINRGIIDLSKKLNIQKGFECLDKLH